MVPPGLSEGSFQRLGVSTAVDALLRWSTQANVICRLIIYALPEGLQARFEHCIAGDFACTAETLNVLQQLKLDTTLAEDETQAVEAAIAYISADNTTASCTAAHAQLVAEGGECVKCEGGCRFKFATPLSSC